MRGAPEAAKNVSKNPGFFYRFTKDSNVDPAEVSKNDPILLANLEMSFYCTIIEFLVDSTKINNTP